MPGTDTALVVDLYSGPGGVGIALDALGVDHVGVDVVDYSDEYPGTFVQGDASKFAGGDFDLAWCSPPCTAYSSLSPSYYGSREAAMDACPTIPELNVREIAERVADEYVIENVPGATRAGHLRDPTRINGLAFGLPFDLERHFETSFPVPDAIGTGQPEVVIDTRGDQSAAALAAAKDVPTEWGKQAVRSAIPREYVRHLLHYCPSVPDVALPEGTPKQTTLRSIVG